MNDSFQHMLYKKAEAETMQESNEACLLQNVVEPGQYIPAGLNRKTNDMNAEEKSDRLLRLMTRRECQTMICKKILYHKSRRVMKQSGQDAPWYKLFDGIHRFVVTNEFLNGECYVKMRNPEDDCDYYLWNTQEAVDAITEYKEYHQVIEDEWRVRLMTCPVNMILLDPKMTDGEAYDRARIANKCKALTPAQIIKCLCAKNTGMAKLLQDMNAADDDMLALFLDDEIYRINASILRIFVEHSFDEDFTPHTKMLQGANTIQKAETLITGGEQPDDGSFATQVLGASNMARKIMNDMIAEHDPILKKTINSQQSAVGHMYFALTLACANANAEVLVTTDYICKEAASSMLDTYLLLDGSQKIDNNKRFYTFFTTGTFPDAPDKGKKRKATHDAMTEETAVTEI